MCEDNKKVSREQVEYYGELEELVLRHMKEIAVSSNVCDAHRIASLGRDKKMLDSIVKLGTQSLAVLAEFDSSEALGLAIHLDVLEAEAKDCVKSFLQRYEAWPN